MENLTSVPYLNLSLKNIRGEKWVDIPDYEGYYQLSSFGRVKGLERIVPRNVGKGELRIKEQILKPTCRRHLNPFTGDYIFHLVVSFSKDARKTTILIQRMVYYLFVQKFDLSDTKLVVVAKDGNNLNIHYKNLRLISKSEVQIKTYMDERKRKLFKKISQYTCDGVLVKTYPSVDEAAEQTGMNANSISQTAHGHMHHLGGYLWRFGSRKKIRAVKFPYRNVKRIAQYLRSGRLLRTYFSITEGTEMTGFTYYGIKKALDKGSSYKGCVWKYVD